MKRFFKLTAVFISLAFLFSFTACSDFDDGENSSISGAEQSVLKELVVSILLDEVELAKDCTLENGNVRKLSFKCSDSETGKTDGLPSVNAKWKIVTGSSYVLLSASEGSEIQIANTNYSNSVQPINIQLTVSPESKNYKSKTVDIKLNASILTKKDITAVILYDGKAVSEKPTLGSAADVLLSYSISDSVYVNSKWEIETGANYVASTDRNANLKISNINCSGKNQEVTVKLTLTPNNLAYNVTSKFITFIVEDSTEDLQPGAFTISANLGTDTAGNYDGTVKISWTESKNAKSYYVYRNEKQIAVVTDELQYIDKNYGSDKSLSNGKTVLTYYVKATNLVFSNNTDTVNVDFEELLPATPKNVAIYLKKDSYGYYYTDMTWETDGSQECEVYRLVTGFLGLMGADVVQEGKLIETTSKNKLESGDYSFMNEISDENYNVVYSIVTKRTWDSTGVTLCSKQARYYFDATSLVGKPAKPGTSSGTTSGSSSSSSGKVKSISISASRCIVYNRYSYCQVHLPSIPGATFRIYRCARRSNQFGTVSPDSCDYIGETTWTTYHDGDVCNKYEFENKSSSGKYFYYMYYYVEATDSDGNKYVSSVVRAD